MKAHGGGGAMSEQPNSPSCHFVPILNEPCPYCGPTEGALEKPSERISAKDVLQHYRCQHTVDYEGDGVSLVDVLSPGDTVKEGLEEIELIVDALAAPQQREQGEPRTEEGRFRDFQAWSARCIAGCHLDGPTGTMWHSPGCPNLLATEPESHRWTPPPRFTCTDTRGGSNKQRWEPADDD